MEVDVLNIFLLSFRLFSHGDGLTSPPPVTQDTRVSQSPGGPAPEQPNHSTPDKDSGVDSFTESPPFKPAALTLNLAKANEESNNSSLNNSKTNSSSKQPRNRCDELRSMLKSALELAHDVARHKYGDQTLKVFILVLIIKIYVNKKNNIYM